MHLPHSDKACGLSLAVIGIYLYPTGNQRLARKAIGPSVHVAIPVGPLGRSATRCITVAVIVRLQLDVILGMRGSHV